MLFGGWEVDTNRRRDLRFFGFERALDEITIEDVALDLLTDKLKINKSKTRYTALCPFHREKTPSFNVELRYNRYVCYGCLKMGGPLILPFDFYEKISS